MCDLATTRITQIKGELKEIGKIRREGGRKGGYWVVL